MSVQAKDLSAEDVIRVVGDHPDAATGVARWDIEGAFSAGFPPRVVNAKLVRLVRQGYLDGCAHSRGFQGCDGGFTVTPKGKARTEVCDGE